MTLSTYMCTNANRSLEAFHITQHLDHACDACRKEQIRCRLGRKSDSCLHYSMLKRSCVLLPHKPMAKESLNQEEDDYLEWLRELEVK